MVPKTEVFSTDILIIGGGIAGLIAANRASQDGLNVLVVEKASAGYAGQAILSGGMTWAVGPDDNINSVARWQIERGDYLNDQARVVTLAQRIYPALLELIDWGMPLEKDGDGRPLLTNPHGFSHAYRMVTFDTPKLTPRLRRRAARQKVLFVDKTQVVELLTRKDQVVGAVGYNLLDTHPVVFRARAVILANGSCDFKAERLFSSSCGEGIAAAYRAGAVMRNAEFGNLYGPRLKDMDLSFRGNLLEKMENGQGERIYKRYVTTDDGEHMHRLVQGIVREREAGRGPVSVDFSALPLDFDDSLRPPRNNPSNPDRLVERLAQLGIGSAYQEIVLAFQGKLSPVKVDATYRTTLPGLWAIGDVSHLGSAWEGAIPGGEVPGPCIAYAIMSGLDGAASAVEYAQGVEVSQPDEDGVQKAIEFTLQPLARQMGESPQEVVEGISALAAAIPTSLFRSQRSLEAALEDVLLFEDRAAQVKAEDGHELLKCHEASSMALCLEMEIRAALHRDESRGTHLREDYPAQDDEKEMSWINLRKDGAQMTFWREPIPVETYPFQPGPRPSPWAPGESQAKIEVIPVGAASQTELGQSLHVDVSGQVFQDLDDKRVCLGDFLGDVLIFSSAGQKGAALGAEWDAALAGRLANQPGVRLFRLAPVEKLPVFVPKSIVKNELKKAKVAIPFLVDWQARKDSPFALSDPQTPSLSIVDSSGTLVWRYTGTYSEQALQAVLDALTKLVDLHS